MHIGSLQLDNPLILAPMAGVTDLPYRLIAKRFGASLVHTEMVSANGLIYNGRATRNLLISRLQERPLGIQLFGEDPQRIADAIKLIESSADLVDLNLGCPVKKVVKSGAGSALLKEPKKVGDLLASARAATSLPLTVKIRSGWDQQSINFQEIAMIAEAEGIDAINFHPRTRNQMFGGVANWDQIRLLKEKIKIPVIGSGDLFNPHDIKTMFDQTGCDAVMIARGGYGNPWLFSQAASLIAGKPFADPSVEERAATAKRHMALSLEIFGPAKSLGLMRKHLSWYVRGLECATHFRERINKAQNFETLIELLDNYFANAA